MLKNIISITAANKISEIISPLKKIGVNRFNHDITYGDEKISFITSNASFFQFYYQHEFPLMCTNKEGRILDNGIYLSKYLSHHYNDYSVFYPVIEKQFHFKNAIHFVERENEMQHFYTFAFSLAEPCFTHAVIKNINHIKNFLNIYKIAAKDIITEAKKSKNIIKLPYCHDIGKNNLLEKINLTSREIEILTWMSHGKTIEQISQLINIKTVTINKHIANIKIKTKCYTQFQLGAFFQTHWILDPV